LISRRRWFWLEVSPLLAFVVSFIVVVVCYALGWSELYPPLSWDLAAFIGLTVLVCFAVMTIVRMLWRPAAPNVTMYWNIRRTVRATCALYALTILEFLHSGGVPIALLLGEGTYDYRDFGIPVLHVAIFAAYCFLAVHWFSIYMQLHDRRYLICSGMLMAINVLIVNRGAFVQCSLAIGLLFALHRGFRLRTVLTMSVTTILLIVAFGLIGDARMAAMGMDPSVAIAQIGEVSAGYPEGLGSGPFWVYLYASSPLANWQLNVSRDASIHIAPLTFVALEMLPDFIGKRLVPDEIFSIGPMLITDALNVSSAFGRAFYLQGWAGAIAVFTQFLLYYFIARRLFRGTEYFPSAMATFSAGSALLVFHNMLTFAGFVGPLIFAALLRLLHSRRRRRAQRSSSANGRRAIGVARASAAGAVPESRS
jgi:hypothetical protein